MEAEYKSVPQKFNRKEKSSILKIKKQLRFRQSKFLKHPYSAVELFHINHNYQNIQPKFQHVNISEEAKDFIKRCLEPEQNKRIKWPQIYKHPLINKKDPLSLIYGLIAKIVDFEDENKFYQEKQKNKKDIKPIFSQDFTNCQDSSCQFMKVNAESVIYCQLIQESIMRKQKDQLFARYQQMYNTEVKNILFFFRFIFPHVHKFENQNLNHTITMLILIKEVHSKFDQFCYKLTSKQNFTNMPEDDFSSFVETDFYKELSSRALRDNFQIYDQMQSYDKDLEQFKKTLSEQMQSQLRILFVLGEKYQQIKTESIESYWFILADNLKGADGNQKQYLIRVIKALQYLKSTNEIGSDQFGSSISIMDFVQIQKQVLKEWERKIYLIQE